MPTEAPPQPSSPITPSPVQVPPPKDDVQIAAESGVMEAAMKARYREAMAKSNPPAQPAPPAAPVQTGQIGTVGGPGVPGVSGEYPAAPAPAVDESIPAHERPPEGASKASKEHWDRFRTMKNSELESVRKEKEALAKEIAALKEAKPNGTSQEAEAWKKEKADLESRLERLDLENSPRFKNHYDNEIEKRFELIKEVAGTHADELLKLISAERSPERTARLKEIKEELGMEGDMVGIAVSEIAKLKMERKKQLDNHKENMKLLRATEAQEAQERTSKEAQQRSAIADSIVERAKSLPEFKAAPTDTEHVAFATSALDFIKSANLGKLDKEDFALLPVAAMKAQYHEKFTIPKLTAEIAKLTARIEQLTGAAPRLEGGAKPPDPGAAPLPSDPMAAVKVMTDRYKEKMGR